MIDGFDNKVFNKLFDTLRGLNPDICAQIGFHYKTGNASISNDRVFTEEGFEAFGKYSFTHAYQELEQYYSPDWCELEALSFFQQEDDSKNISPKTLNELFRILQKNVLTIRIKNGRDNYIYFAKFRKNGLYFSTTLKSKNSEDLNREEVITLESKLSTLAVAYETFLTHTLSELNKSNAEELKIHNIIRKTIIDRGININDLNNRLDAIGGNKLLFAQKILDVKAENDGLICQLSDDAKGLLSNPDIDINKIEEILDEAWIITKFLNKQLSLDTPRVIEAGTLSELKKIDSNDLLEISEKRSKADLGKFDKVKNYLDELERCATELVAEGISPNGRAIAEKKGRSAASISDFLSTNKETVRNVYLKHYEDYPTLNSYRFRPLKNILEKMKATMQGGAV
jgi:hypothetical protein